MNWVRLLGPVLGPFTDPLERRLRERDAIRKANQSFRHITQFIAEFNETLVKDLPPGLASSAGVKGSRCCIAPPGEKRPRPLPLGLKLPWGGARTPPGSIYATPAFTIASAPPLLG